MENIIQYYNMKFWNIVNQYDTNNPNIIRKILHSLAVADKCFEIACHNSYDEEKRTFCYLMGLFHDIGRFEQWKLYNTYNDGISIDHGDLSAEIISKISIEDLKITNDSKIILMEAIKYHTKEYLGNNDEIIKFNQIIKNADAYCNILTIANGAQQITTNNDGYSAEIMEAFCDRKILRKFVPKTKLDRILMLTTCVYSVNLIFLRHEIVANNYIDIIFDRFSKYLNIEDCKLYLKCINDLKDKYFE